MPMCSLLVSAAWCSQHEPAACTPPVSGVLSLCLCCAAGLGRSATGRQQMANPRHRHCLQLEVTRALACSWMVGAMTCQQLWVRL